MTSSPGPVLYTHKWWNEYAWESINPAQHMTWDIRRCDYVDPHEHPAVGSTVFYTDTELVHALRHRNVHKIAWMLESPQIAGHNYDYLETIINEFDMVLTYVDRLVDQYPDKCVFYPHGNCLVERADFEIYEKSKLVSFIASKKRLGTSGHMLRSVFHQLVTDPEPNWARDELGDMPIDLFGPLADNYIDHKIECLQAYRFHITIENSQVDTYFTEKILDCFVTGTVPIYYGTRNIGRFFDEDGLITFNTLDELVSILPTLDRDLYESKRAAIERNFEIARELVVAEDWIHQNTSAFDFGSASPIGWGSRLPALPQPQSGVAAGRANRNRADALSAVTERAKKTIQSVDDMPAELVSTVEPGTRSRRPMTLDPADAERPFFDSITSGHLLQIPNGFIGDNVVFDHERYYGLGKWWLGHSAELYRHITEVRHVERAVSVCGWGGEAFQHFVLDAVPKLATVIDWLESPEFADVKIVTHSDQCAISQWLFERLGLGDRVVQKPLNSQESFVISTDMAYFAHYEPCSHSFGLFPRDSLRPLQERLGLLDSAIERDLVVYLQRKGMRSVADEAKLLADIEPVIEQAGCQLHVFHASGDFDKDLQVLRRARAVVGPHGGAFANLAFVPPEAAVIEFVDVYFQFTQSDDDARRNYWGLAQAAGHHYWALAPDKFGFDDPDMVVDSAALVAMLEIALLS